MYDETADALYSGVLAHWHALGPICARATGNDRNATAPSAEARAATAKMLRVTDLEFIRSSRG
jgi:hypothetical protein